MEDSKKLKEGIELRENNNQLTLDDLEKTGMYDSYILDCLRREEYDKLLLLSPEARKDAKYMEPLLYAVKNDLGIFRVFQYYGENLQGDYELALEVIRSEPELIANTPFSRSKQFILRNIRNIPQLVRYMDSSLKENEEMVCNLCKLNLDVMDELVSDSEINFERVIEYDRNNNQSGDSFEFGVSDLLENNRDFIASGVEERGPEFLQYASEEIKNDYDFLKEMAAKDEETIEYVIENADKFGIDGINGVREATKEIAFNDCKEMLEEVVKNETDDPRYAKVLARIEEAGYDDPRVLRWATAMINQRDDVSPETLKKVLNYAMITMEQRKKELGEEIDFSDERTNQLAEFVEPRVLRSLKEKAEAQGIELDPDFDEKINKYDEFYSDYNQKIKAYKREHRQEFIDYYNKKKMEEEQQNQSSKNSSENKENIPSENSEKDYKINIGDIEEATSEVTFNQIQDETKATIQEVKRDEQQEIPEEKKDEQQEIS